MRPYGRHMLICGHGDCAPAEAGRALEMLVRNGLGDRRRLRNPERVKVSLVDCLGVCTGGPIAVVYPDGVWYHHLDADLARRIAQEHLVEGKPVESAIFHRLYPPDVAAPYAPALRGDGDTFAGDGPEATTTAAETETSGSEGAPSSEPTTEARDARRAAVRKEHRKKGLVIVNTGNGKGKTTSALGIATRAWGRGMRVGVLQFLKHQNARFGEVRAAEKMGISWLSTGDGWTWTSKDLDETAARARHGWEVAKGHITSGQFDVLILDEFTYPLHYGWVDVADVLTWLAATKPPMLHLIITGRYAPAELIAYADLVTEMREVKHPFSQQGIRAQPGIEF